MPPELSQLNIVSVSPAAGLEYEHELMLASVETSHAGIVLDPHANVFQFRIGRPAGGDEFAGMTPIHADEMDRAIETVPGELRAGEREKGGEFRLAHFAGGHHEIWMMHPAEPRRMAIDFYVVRRVAKNHGSALSCHQCFVGPGVERIAAEDPMFVEKPQVSRLTDRRSGGRRGNGVRRFVRVACVVQTLDP
jgi:hypothetical protein